MSNHDELIERLRASAAAMPFDAAVAVQYRAAVDALEAQAQAGAVPLTCEWAHNEDDGFWDTECGQSWRFDDGGPKENHMNFCHCCGKPLRIKGGQHGVE